MNKQNIKFIRGIEGKGEKIAQMLKELDVKNFGRHTFQDPYSIYFFCEDKCLNNIASATPIGQLIIENCEELFLPAVFKYKVGDKVIFSTANLIGEIKELKDVKGDPCYKVDILGTSKIYREENLILYFEHKYKEGDLVQFDDDNNNVVIGMVKEVAKTIYTIETANDYVYLKEHQLEPFDKSKVKKWEDLKGIPIKGYWVDYDGEIIEEETNFNENEMLNVAATEAVVKSMLAMAQISQLLPYYTKPFTEEEMSSSAFAKYYFIFYEGKIGVDWYCYKLRVFPSFRKKEEAERFLQNNPRLVHDLLMIPYEEPQTQNN